MFRRTALVFALVLVAAAVASAQQHPFNVHDLVAMQRVSDPQPSPDGKRAAFVVTKMDLEANKGRRDIWLAATDGSGVRRLTTDVANDWSFQGLTQEETKTPYITVYGEKDKLLWGEEPECHKIRNVIYVE